MKWDEKNQEYIFNSGRKVYANHGIIGLGLDDDVSEGYDGSFGPSYLFTAAERREIAAYMIERWRRWSAGDATGGAPARVHDDH